MDVGEHYLIELFDCNIVFLDDKEYLKSALRKAIKDSGATEIGHLFHKYEPQGVSGVILISESHFSIHTWPEHKYAAVDFFTCGNSVRIHEAYANIKNALESKNSTIQEIKRGPIDSN